MKVRSGWGGGGKRDQKQRGGTGEETGCEMGGGGTPSCSPCGSGLTQTCPAHPDSGAIYLFPLGLRESAIKVVITFTLKSH